MSATAVVLEAVDPAVQFKTNLVKPAPIVATETKKKQSKKGRPTVHTFPGRINLLREEVEFALKDGDAFIEMMNKAHKFDKERYNELIAAGIIDPSVTQFWYTFQGPIDMVLDEMHVIEKRYQHQVEEGKASLRFDFHKVKTMADPSKKKKPTKEELALYREPVMQRIGQDDVCLKLEAYPDMIYGYVEVTIKNENLVVD